LKVREKTQTNNAEMCNQGRAIRREALVNTKGRERSLQLNGRGLITESNPKRGGGWCGGDNAKGTQME